MNRFLGLGFKKSESWPAFGFCLTTRDAQAAVDTTKRQYEYNPIYR